MTISLVAWWADSRVLSGRETCLCEDLFTLKLLKLWHGLLKIKARFVAGPGHAAISLCDAGRCIGDSGSWELT